jgi:hypothetical protein
MRIAIEGKSPSASVLRGMITHERVGYILSDRKHAHYVLELEPGSAITIDASDSTLERNAINCIAELTDSSIVLKRSGAVSEENRIRVWVPPGEAEACEVGLLRAVLKTCGHGTKPAPSLIGSVSDSLSIIPTPVAILISIAVFCGLLAAAAIFARADETQGALPIPISLEDKERAEALYIKAYSAAQRVQDGNIRKLQAQLDIEHAQKDLDGFNLELGKLTETLRVKSNASAERWDIGDDFKWVPCDPKKNPECIGGSR